MKLSSCLALFLLIVLPAIPQTVFAAPTADDCFYVAPQDLPPQLLPPPVDHDSRRGRADLEAVLKAQQHIRPLELKEIRDEQHLRLEIITGVMGQDFTRERLPRTFALLDHVLSDTQNISMADKKFWHTKRPYLIDQRVRLLVDPLDNSPSYPSGHTSAVHVIAEVL